MKKIFDETGKETSIYELFNSTPLVYLPFISRVEVIDNNGRSYVNYNTEGSTSISIQDKGQTLKIFTK